MTDFQDLPKEKLIAEIERLKKELKKKKKYGLVWEEKTEEVVEMCKEKLPVLKEVKDKEIITDKNKPVNLLIEGDNYHALSVLNYTHAKKIDVIYIDPPYNTGNKDFIFNDHYVDREDAYRHSKWLAFMEKRLKLAKNLLKDTGVIFISIDDNEVAQLKLLMDHPDLFGEGNYIDTIVVELTKTQGMKVKAAQEGGIVKNYEYVLIYGKNSKNNSKIVKNILYDSVERYDPHYSYVLEKDDHSKFKIFRITDFLLKQPKIKKELETLEAVKDGKLSINDTVKAINISDIIRQYIFNQISEIVYQETDCRIKIPEETKRRLATNYAIQYKDYIIHKSSGGKIRQFISLKKALNYDHGYKPTFGIVTIRGNLWKGFYADMMNIAKEGNVELKSGKKPSRMIKQLIYWVSDKNAIVLDFFAGSGSTGHAVLELNKEDQGNRRFILCTNNQDENGGHRICTDICYPRLKNAIFGSRNKVGLGGNLKYFKTDFVGYEEPTDSRKIKLTRQATEMLCVKEGTFEEVTKPAFATSYAKASAVKKATVGEGFKIFKNSDHYTGIIFDQSAIPIFKKVIKDLRGKFSVYVFSLGDETFDEEFEGVKQKVQLSPIPEAILRVYRRIFK